MGFDGIMQAANKNTCTRNVEVEFLVENVLEDRQYYVVQFSPWITAPRLTGWLSVVIYLAGCIIMTFFSSTASEFPV